MVRLWQLLAAVVSADVPLKEVLAMEDAVCEEDGSSSCALSLAQKKAQLRKKAGPMSHAAQWKAMITKHDDTQLLETQASPALETADDPTLWVKNKAEQAKTQKSEENGVSLLVGKRGVRRHGHRGDEKSDDAKDGIVIYGSEESDDAKDVADKTSSAKHHSSEKASHKDQEEHAQKGASKKKHQSAKKRSRKSSKEPKSKASKVKDGKTVSKDIKDVVEQLEAGTAAPPKKGAHRAHREPEEEATKVVAKEEHDEQDEQEEAADAMGDDDEVDSLEAMASDEGEEGEEITSDEEAASADAEVEPKASEAKPHKHVDYGHPAWVQECHSIFLDLGTGQGTNVRKVFEPRKYAGSHLLEAFEDTVGSSGWRRAKYEKTGLCALGLEPNPRHQARLSKLEKTYTGLGWHVHFYPFAAWKEEGFMTLNTTSMVGWQDPELQPGAHLNTSEDTSSEPGPGKVRTVDLVDFLRSLPQGRLGTVIMDIEGAEYETLAKLMQEDLVCNQTVKHLLVDAHSWGNVDSWGNASTFMEGVHPRSFIAVQERFHQLDQFGWCRPYGTTDVRLFEDDNHTVNGVEDWLSKTMEQGANDSDQTGEQLATMGLVGPLQSNATAAVQSDVTATAATAAAAEPQLPAQLPGTAVQQPPAQLPATAVPQQPAQAMQQPAQAMQQPVAQQPAQVMEQPPVAA